MLRPAQRSSPSLPESCGLLLLLTGIKAFPMETTEFSQSRGLHEVTAEQA